MAGRLLRVVSPELCDLSLQARAATPEIWCSRPDASALAEQQAMQAALQREWFQRSAPLRTAIVRRQVFFPDRRLIQFDCGKLQASPCTPFSTFPAADTLRSLAPGSRLSWTIRRIAHCFVQGFQWEGQCTRTTICLCVARIRDQG